MASKKVELKFQTANLKATIEKRGRMLRRARRFGRSAWYQTHVMACAAVSGPGVLRIAFDPVKQTFQLFIDYDDEVWDENVTVAGAVMRKLF